MGRDSNRPRDRPDRCLAPGLAPTNPLTEALAPEPAGLVQIELLDYNTRVERPLAALHELK